MANRIPNALNDFADKDTTAVWSQELVDFLTVEAWHEVGATGNPAFENSWANVGGVDEVASFYKNPYNLVRIVGVIDTGASGTTAFTLPTGYIPSKRVVRHLLVTGASAGTFVHVNTDGTVDVTMSTGTVAYLDISFRV